MFGTAVLYAELSFRARYQQTEPGEIYELSQNKFWLSNLRFFDERALEYWFPSSTLNTGDRLHRVHDISIVLYSPIYGFRGNLKKDLLGRYGVGIVCDVSGRKDDSGFAEDLGRKCAEQDILLGSSMFDGECGRAIGATLENEGPAGLQYGLGPSTRTIR